MLPYCQPLDVLEYKVRRFQLGDDANEITHQGIARIVQSAVSDEGESLTGCATDNDIDAAPPNTGRPSYVASAKTLDATRYHGAIREVELVDRSVDGVDFDSSNHVEPSLFKPKAKPPSSRKQINANWSRHRRTRIA
jgi:hypothetical protein